MPITGPGSTKEALADAYIALGDRISLHTGNPGTAGANEASGGSPAYARQVTTWSADTTDDGERLGTQVTIDVPAGTYTHVGIWSSGGSFIDGYDLPTDIVMSVQGQIKITPKYTQS